MPPHFQWPAELGRSTLSGKRLGLLLHKNEVQSCALSEVFKLAASLDRSSSSFPVTRFFPTRQRPRLQDLLCQTEHPGSKLRCFRPSRMRT